MHSVILNFPSVFVSYFLQQDVEKFTDIEKLYLYLKLPSGPSSGNDKRYISPRFAALLLSHTPEEPPSVSPTPGFKSPRVQKYSNLVQSLKQIKVIGWLSALFHLCWNSTNSCFIYEITTYSPLWPAGGSISQVTDASFLSADSSLEGGFFGLVMIYHPKTH